MVAVSPFAAARICLVAQRSAAGSATGSAGSAAGQSPTGAREVTVIVVNRRHENRLCPRHNRCGSCIQGEFGRLGANDAILDAFD